MSKNEETRARDRFLDQPQFERVGTFTRDADGRIVSTPISEDDEQDVHANKRARSEK